MTNLKFRKKHVAIAAFELHPDDGLTRQLPPSWLIAALVSGKVKAIAGGGMEIGTLGGQMRADVGDWIIQGIKGEIYPCKPDIFAATYEPATGAAA